jgi:hypothetical protein
MSFAPSIGIAGAALVTLLVGPPSPHPPIEPFRCSLRTPSPRDGYDPVALVAASTVIVRARADSIAPSEHTRPPGPRDLVHFTVLEVIDSGAVSVPRHLAFIGYLSQKADFNPRPVPYRWVRPDGLRGACHAYTYQQGGEFLLLLKGDTPDAMTPYWAAHQPTNEQVRGAGDPWMAWVRATNTARRAR